MNKMKMTRMARYRKIVGITLKEQQYPDILEMANQVGHATNENLTILSARILRDALTRIIAKKGIKIKIKGSDLKATG